MTRMFVAVIPPDEVLDDLEAFLEPRRGEVPFRWTDPEQWHLTLAFSRDVPERSYDDLVDRLARAARKRSPIEARILGGGAFPNVGRAKIVYAGVETDREELRRMATGARAAVAKAGAEVDGHRFTPHLTLARITQGRRGEQVRAAARRVRRTDMDRRGDRPWSRRTSARDRATGPGTRSSRPSASAALVAIQCPTTLLRVVDDPLRVAVVVAALGVPRLVRGLA